MARDPERLHLDPGARDRVALERARSSLARERDEASDLRVEPRDQRQPERPALVQERRHRDLPAAAHLAEDVVERHLGAVEEDLVELGLAGELSQRANLDAGAAHVQQQHRQPGAAGRRRIGADEQQAAIRHVRVRRPDLLPWRTSRSLSSRPAVRSAARSDPASGSENPWHQISAAERMGERNRACCASVPCAMIVGPAIPIPITPTCGGASARDLLLVRDRLVARGESSTAVRHGPGQTREPRLVQSSAPLPTRLEVRGRDAVRVAAELIGQVLLEPVAKLGAERGLVRDVAEVHAAMLSTTCCRARRRRSPAARGSADRCQSVVTSPATPRANAATAVIQAASSPSSASRSSQAAPIAMNAIPKARWPIRKPLTVRSPPSSERTTSSPKPTCASTSSRPPAVPGTTTRALSWNPSTSPSPTSRPEGRTIAPASTSASTTVVVSTRDEDHELADAERGLGAGRAPRRARRRAGRRCTRRSRSGSAGQELGRGGGAHELVADAVVDEAARRPPRRAARR